MMTFIGARTKVASDKQEKSDTVRVVIRGSLWAKLLTGFRQMVPDASGSFLQTGVFDKT